MNDVGLLQLKMSGTKKEKEGKTNMFLSNMFLVCRFQIVGAKKGELELRSMLRTVVPISRLARVTNGTGAHKHMGVQNGGRHAIAETRELVHGHEVSAG